MLWLIILIVLLLLAFILVIIYNTTRKPKQKGIDIIDEEMGSEDKIDIETSEDIQLQKQSSPLVEIEQKKEEVKIINNTIIEPKCKEMNRIFTLSKDPMFLFCYNIKPNTITTLTFKIYALDKCNNQYLKTLKVKVVTECGNMNHLVTCESVANNMKCERIEAFYHFSCSDIRFYVKGEDCERIVWSICMREDCEPLCPFKYNNCCLQPLQQIQQ